MKLYANALPSVYIIDTDHFDNPRYQNEMNLTEKDF